jgi:hypothetical protein
VLELGGPAVHQLAVASTLPRVALTEDGALLAVAADGAVRLWAVAEGTVVRTLATGTGPAVSLKLSDSPTPDLLVTFDRAAAPTDNAKVWRVADGILVGLATGGPLGTFTHADAALLLLDTAGTAFDVVSFGGRLLHHAALPEPLGHTAFAADGAYLGGVTGAGTADEHLAVMAVDEEAFTWRSPDGVLGTRQLLFLENPSRIVRFAERAVVHDHAGGQVLRALPALDEAQVVAAAPDGASIAAVLPRGALVLVATSDGSVRPGPALPAPACM